MTVRLPRKERIKQITNLIIIIIIITIIIIIIIIIKTIIKVHYDYNKNVPEFHKAKKISFLTLPILYLELWQT